MDYFFFLIFNPTAYIIFAHSRNRPFEEIFFLYFLYSTLFNILCFFFPDFLEKIAKRFFNRKSESKVKRLERKIRIALLKIGRRIKIAPLIIYFISGILPIPLIKEASLIVSRILRINFSVFIAMNVLQFIVFYFIGKIFF